MLAHVSRTDEQVRLPAVNWMWWPHCLLILSLLSVGAGMAVSMWCKNSENFEEGCSVGNTGLVLNA